MKRDNQIEIILPTDSSWVSLAEDVTRKYAHSCDFAEQLVDMIAFSVNEVCGTLCERASTMKSKLHHPYRLCLSSDEEAVEVSVVFDGSIPLNPLKEKPYEVPDEFTDLDDMVIDSMWLILLKHRMDRVFFAIDGATHSLHLVKYRRGKGKEREVWIMNLKPKLDNGVFVNRQSPDGIGYVQEYKSGKILRLGAAEMDAVSKMDGETCIRDIFMEAMMNGLRVSPKLYIRLYDELLENGMIHQENSGERSFVQRCKDSLGNLVFTVPHSDEIAEWFHRHFRFFFTSVGTVLSLLIGLSGFYPLCMTIDDMVAIYHDSYRLMIDNVWILVAVYGIASTSVILHELAHAGACKHYGGKVPRMGVMAYLSSLIFFCDVTSSYLFPKKQHRVMVALAGPMATFVFWGVSLWVFLLTVSPAWKLVWMAIVVMETFVLIMNFNPLLKMDSYYMLTEWLGIENMRTKAFVILSNWAKRMVRIHSVPLKIPQSEVKPLFAYALLGGFFTLVFYILPLAYCVYLLFFTTDSGWVKFSWAVFLSLILLFNVFRMLVLKWDNIRHQRYNLTRM